MGIDIQHGYEIHNILGFFIFFYSSNWVFFLFFFFFFLTLSGKKGTKVGMEKKEDAKK